MTHYQRPAYRPDRNSRRRVSAIPGSQPTTWLAIGLAWLIIVVALTGTLLIFSANGVGPLAVRIIVPTRVAIAVPPTLSVVVPPDFQAQRANDGTFIYIMPNDWFVTTQAVTSATLTRIYNSTGATFDIYAAVTTLPTTACQAVIAGAFGTGPVTIAAAHSATIGVLPATALDFTASVKGIGYTGICYQSTSRPYVIIMTAPTKQFAADNSRYLQQMLAAFAVTQ